VENPQQGPAPKQGYLRPREREELQQDIGNAEAELNEADPAFRVDDRNQVNARRGRLQHQLDAGKAPELTPLQRDAKVKEARELGDYLSGKMLSRDEMMKNPPGTVGKNIKYHRETKDAQLRWKALQLELNPESQDPDIANLEQIRPESNRSVSYANSQIGQDNEAIHSVPSRAYMANYDDIEWDAAAVMERLDKQSSMLEQAASLIEKQQQRIDSLEGPSGPNRQAKPKQPASEAKIAAMAKARSAKAAKAAAKKAAQAEGEEQKEAS